MNLSLLLYSIFRLGYEPLVMMLLVLMPLGIAYMRRHSVPSSRFMIISTVFWIVIIGRIIALYFLRVEHSRRYFLPLLYFILVFSGPILVGAFRSLNEKYRPHFTLGYTSIFLLLAVYLVFRRYFLALPFLIFAFSGPIVIGIFRFRDEKHRPFRILGYAWLFFLLAVYFVSSVIKISLNNRPNRRVAVWSREVKKIIGPRPVMFVDSSKRGNQILWETGCGLQKMIPLHGGAQSVFFEIYSNGDLLKKEKEWWFMCKTSELNSFSRDYRLYACKYPFEEHPLSYGYTLLRYYDNDKCFSMLPAGNVDAGVMRACKTTELPIGTKIICVGDALFCSGKIQKALLSERPDLKLLGSEPFHISASPLRREGFSNYGWASVLNKTVLEDGGKGRFAHYCEEKLKGSRPDIVLISAGLSELYAEGPEFVTSANRSVEKMCVFLDTLTKQEPALKIGVIIPLHPPRNTDYSKSANAKIIHFEFIDYYERMVSQAIMARKYKNVFVIHLPNDPDMYQHDFKLSNRCPNYMLGVSEAAAKEISRELLIRCAEFYTVKQ